MTNPHLSDNRQFTAALYQKMQEIAPPVRQMTNTEFGYALENVVPPDGWDSISLKPANEIKVMLADEAFYKSILLKPKLNNQIVMDPQIKNLLQVLFVGLVTEDYSISWVNEHFYFDVRGFYFINKTHYFTPEITAHLGGTPYQEFEKKQAGFSHLQAVGYKAFRDANTEVDQCFIDTIQKLIAIKGTPIIIAIAGQTAAGKTEITSRLTEAFQHMGKRISTLEIDNFLTDRDYREANGIDSLGKGALHYDLLQKCMKEISAGKRIRTPRYDFVLATSSHTLSGALKPGCQPIEIEPADIIFMEGNFPFLLPEIAPLIGIKTIYLTADDVRMKRKWKRDMDYRKKYDLYYFLNRYFREQFLMAEQAYKPQMTLCDLLVDTTEAAVWVTPYIRQLLEVTNKSPKCDIC